RGFRESTNQRYYALGWDVGIQSASAVNTSFYPAHQQTSFRLGGGDVTKTFFLPFEIGYSRACHYLLECSAGAHGALLVRSLLLLAPGSTVEPANFKGWKYAVIRFSGEGAGILWGSAATASFESKTEKEYTELLTEYEWPAGDAFGLSFL